MIRLLILLCFSINTYATEYLIYSEHNSVIKKYYKGTDVFSEKEKKLLLGTNVQTNVIKIKITDDKKFKEYMRLNYPSATIELNHKIELFSHEQYDQFEKYQWGLKNNGEVLEDWFSDIDVVQTLGIKGEDIQIDENEKNKKIKVAIIDSGIDINHPDLKDQIYHHPEECAALKEYNSCLSSTTDKDLCHEKYASFDANANGYPLDCHGWNVSGKSNPMAQVDGSGNISDKDGHGTHVSGIIGAKKNNIGIRGVIQNVVLLPVQVSVSSQSKIPQRATDQFAKALLYAIKSQAQIINMSLGWRFEQDSILIRDMINLAYEKNILVVAAAGNDHHAAPTYPCSYDEVICVGAHTVNGKLSSFSNYGAHIDIMAPGTKILSTWPTNKRSRSFTIDDNYEYLSGTSQAAPFVTGVLARLLNQGIGPKEAKIFLLKGARKIVRNTNAESSVGGKNYIRNGNVDYFKSVKAQSNGFLYPQHKSSVLIKWSEEKRKTIKLKFKNYLKESKNVLIDFRLISKSTQPDTYLLNHQHYFKSIKAGEQKVFNLELISPYDIDGNFVIEAHIQSDTEDKLYYVQAKAIRLISPETIFDNRQKQDLHQLTGNMEFLQNSSLKPFKNYSSASEIDFLATKNIDGKTHIALLKHNLGSYHVYSNIEFPVKDPIYINLSKVDLELDGKMDYVLTVVDVSTPQNRVTKFFVLDHLFRPKNIMIAPQNIFKNDITVLPGSFIWLKYNSSMVPAWITAGQRPEIELPQDSIWEKPPVRIRKNRLYLQLPNELKTIDFNGDQEVALHFLYQSAKHRKEGKAMIITSLGYGYYKEFKLYKFDNELIFMQDIKLKRYLDLASSNPLPISMPENSDHAFFNTPSILGEQNVLAIKWNDSNKQLFTTNKKAKTINEWNPIKFVLSFSNQAIMSQTNSYIISQGKNITYGASKTDARRIKHHILVGQQGLFLSSYETPDIGSELIRPYPDNQELYRPAAWQTLGVKGCDEVGFILENMQDKLVYVCADSEVLLKLSL